MSLVLCLVFLALWYCLFFEVFFLLLWAFPINNIIMDDSQMRQGSKPSQIDLNEPSRKCEEKIKCLLELLGKVEFSEGHPSQKLLEDEMVEIEKLIDEESMSRVAKTHEVNMKLIAKLKQLRYDFNQERTVQDYDTIRMNAANQLSALNSIFN